MRFNKKDLIHCDFQYKISHHCGLIFQTGDVVFLKSNPEIQLHVDSVEVSKVHVSWDAVGTRERQKSCFPPECLLHYKHRALQVFRDQFDICLN